MQTSGETELTLSYIYDALGNMTQKVTADSVITMEYDAANRLVSKTENGQKPVIVMMEMEIRQKKKREISAQHIPMTGQED